MSFKLRIGLLKEKFGVGFSDPEETGPSIRDGKLRYESKDGKR